MIRRFLYIALCCVLISVTAVVTPVFAYGNYLMGVIDAKGNEVIPFKYSGIVKLKHGCFLAIKRTPNNFESKIFNNNGIELPHTVPDKYYVDRVYFPDSFAEIENPVKLPHGTIFKIRRKKGSALFCNGNFFIDQEDISFSRQVKKYIPAFKQDGNTIAFAVNVNTLEKESDPKLLETLRYDYKCKTFEDKLGWQTFFVGKDKEKRVGYKDRNGNIRIKPQFYSASKFSSENKAIVCLANNDGSQGKSCAINRAGEVVSPFFDFGGGVYKDLSIVSNDGKYNLVNNQYEYLLKDYAYLLHLYDDVFAFRKRPEDKLKAMNLKGKILFEFPKEIVYAQESDGLVLCAVKEAYYEKYRVPFYSSLCLNKSGKVVFDSHKYKKLSFKDGLAVLQKKEPGRVICAVVDKNGPLFTPIEESSIDVASKDRFLVWRRDKHFYSYLWKADTSGWSRPEMFANLLAEYNLIGMERKKLEKLLGPPEKSEYHALEFYRVGIGGCTEPQPVLEFDFKKDKVRAWRLNKSAWWNSKPIPGWVTTNVVYYWPDSLTARIGESAYYKLYPKRKGWK